MNYFLLILNLIIILELLKILNYLKYIDSLFKLTKKSILIISKKNISDHWKEKIIPHYSFLMIRSSFRMMLIFCLAFSSAILSSLIFNDFQRFLFSINGIISSTLFGFLYIYIKKLIIK